MQRFDQLPYGELVRNSWSEVAKGEGGIARNTIHIPLQQNGRKQPLSRLCRQLPLTGEPNSADTIPVSRSDSGGVPPPGADFSSAPTDATVIWPIVMPTCASGNFCGYRFILLQKGEKCGILIMEETMEYCAAAGDASGCSILEPRQKGRRRL